MLIEQPAKFLRWLYPLAIWRMDTSEKSIYLTFDDGPIPEVTPWVLSVLQEYDVKATFFMVGDNVRKYPEIFQQVCDHGHRIGNHTYNHIGSLRHSIKTYMRNVEKANAYLHTDLFRPPHGWMKWEVYVAARLKYRIIMWDLVTRDYSKWLNGRDVLRNVQKYARNGSIITFHDSLRSYERIRYALPRAIAWLKDEGYEFKVFN